MIEAAEPPADFWEGFGHYLAAEIHRDLAGEDHALKPPSLQKLGPVDIEFLANRVLDRPDGVLWTVIDREPERGGWGWRGRWGEQGGLNSGLPFCFLASSKVFRVCRNGVAKLPPAIGNPSLCRCKLDTVHSAPAPLAVPPE